MLAEDGLSAGEVIGGLLLAVALGLLAAVQAFYANRWLRKRGQGIGEDGVSRSTVTLAGLLAAGALAVPMAPAAPPPTPPDSGSESGPAVAPHRGESRPERCASRGHEPCAHSCGSGRPAAR